MNMAHKADDAAHSCCEGPGYASPLVCKPWLIAPLAVPLPVTVILASLQRGRRWPAVLPVPQILRVVASVLLRTFRGAASELRRKHPNLKLPEFLSQHAGLDFC